MDRSEQICRSSHKPLRQISVSHRIELQLHFFVQKNSTFVLRRDYLRGDFKTQPPVDRRFRPALDGCHCLETDRNRTESPANWRLGFEVIPKQSLVNIEAHKFEDFFSFGYCISSTTHVLLGSLNIWKNETEEMYRGKTYGCFLRIGSLTRNKI